MILLRHTLALAGAGLVAVRVCAAATAAVEPAAPTVVLDLLVEDGRGRPALNLQPDEVVVVQEGQRQTVATLVAHATPGRYELTYVPDSRQGGPIQLQVLRPGVRARGLHGPHLTPRLVMPLSPLETDLQALLEGRPDADDFPLHAGVLQFENTPTGLHHTLAVEVRLTELSAMPPDAASARPLQLFARLKDGEGRVLHRFSLEQDLAGLGQRLVWTPAVHLKPGDYVFETVARDGATSRASVRRRPFRSLEPAPGVRVSSVALLGGAGTVLRGNRAGRAVDADATDDPFFANGRSLMPTLELRTMAAPGARVNFFTIVYPDTANPEPASFRIHLLRDGNIVTSVPLSLPKPEQNGEIRYAAAFPTSTLKPGSQYTLRAEAQQGTNASYEEVPFTIAADSEAQAPVLRFGDKPRRPGD